MLSRNHWGIVVLIKGAGEVASGVAHRLHRCHFRVCMSEVASPLAICRGTAFSEAVFDGRKTIEGVTAVLVNPSAHEVATAWSKREIPIVVDPEAEIAKWLRPEVIVEATMRKKRTSISMKDAPIVIGIGPGFRAGVDVHAVVESNIGNNLGRVILEGEAEPNTGLPVPLGGLERERVLWASRPGLFETTKTIGDVVEEGEEVGRLEGVPLVAPLRGMLRGILRNAVRVPQGTKLIEVDPLNPPEVCWTIREKMRSIAGGVLEAILMCLGP